MAETFAEDMKVALSTAVKDPAMDSGKAETVNDWTDRGNGDDPVSDGQVVNNQASEASARVYEWDEEFGDVGPRLPELECELFGDPENRGQAIDFSKIREIEVTQEGTERIGYIGKFDDAGLHPVMLENVRLSSYTSPTPIQQYTIPAILQGKDVISIAQTGSGKTGAYLIPILSKLMGKAKKLAAKRPNPKTFREGLDDVKAEPLVLIVVPTRELAVQVFNEARKFCYRSMLRPCVVYGGCPIREQINLLAKGCDVLIGTPGRLRDFVFRPHLLTLRRLKYTVIDEADEMLGYDWKDEMDPILGGGEQDEGAVQFCLFSATFPKEARDLAREYLADSHVRFRVGRAGSTTGNIKQVIVETDHSNRRSVLLDLLQEKSGMRTIIFANSRIEVDSLDDFLWNSRLPVVSIHSERSQKDREAAMRAFRSGKAPILVATGVCARGVDVRNVMHVINYELPSIDKGGIEEYIHRIGMSSSPLLLNSTIGRTGRIGHHGTATSFFTERDDGLASVLARTLLETDQEIPGFLRSYLPQGITRETVKFETESDFDPAEYEAAGLGMVQDGATGDGGAGQDAWGADTGAESADAGGWGADTSAGGDAGIDGWGTGNANTSSADAGGGSWSASTHPVPSVPFADW
ncbi:ATP-dependent RNA helicase DDX3X [Geosmithia morbida]|uniref:RNA helicase n=1 Tax=Geosmithia morbida TaxID=1094350 RepID=A0A9P5D5K7_9HYPO|nr:ATP-dependent RNA helicase DDX3X [Geosmithia morbida]KAF4124651.1 ATP-dependent RNA helicase DDX3X [Geosmithia morbida]